MLNDKQDVLCFAIMTIILHQCLHYRSIAVSQCFTEGRLITQEIYFCNIHLNLIDSNVDADAARHVYSEILATRSRSFQHRSKFHHSQSQSLFRCNIFLTLTIELPTNKDFVTISSCTTQVRRTTICNLLSQRNKGIFSNAV